MYSFIQIIIYCYKMEWWPNRKALSTVFMFKEQGGSLTPDIIFIYIYIYIQCIRKSILTIGISKTVRDRQFIKWRKFCGLYREIFIRLKF